MYEKKKKKKITTGKYPKNDKNKLRDDPPETAIIMASQRELIFLHFKSLLLMTEYFVKPDMESFNYVQ